MSLVKLNEILDAADRGGYAVPAVNAYNADTVIAMLEAAREARSPIIVQAYDRLFDSDKEYGVLHNARAVAAITRELAADTDLPVALHVDHGTGTDTILRAIRWGYTSAMIDGSTLDFEGNVALTKQVVSMCNTAGGLPVEGELGHVGSARSGDEATGALTVPEEAAEFVRLTGVYALAVMVGSAHGRYKLPPKLNIGRIAEIKEAAGVPLVLHGGSGIPDDQIKLAIKAGIRKINYATDVISAYYEPFRGKAYDDPIWAMAPDNFVIEPIKSAKEFIIDRMNLCGCAGRA